MDFLLKFMLTENFMVYVFLADGFEEAEALVLVAAQAVNVGTTEVVLVIQEIVGYAVLLQEVEPTQGFHLLVQPTPCWV